MVRARMKVVTVTPFHTHNPDDVCTEIRLMALHDGGGNEGWSKYTPQGEVRMVVTTQAAVEQFELGKHYFVDFHPAD